jgi:PAS domain S-box-containing protein
VSLGELFVRASPVGLALLDHDLRYVKINQWLADLNGIPVEAHYGRTPMELLPGIDPATYTAEMRQALAGTTVHGIHLQGETPAEPGRTRHWEESFYPVFDEDGSVLGVGILAVDVTERHEAQAALEDREATLRLVLESAPSALLLVTPDGLIRDLNAEASRLFGYGPRELVGRSVDLLVPPHVRDRHSRLRAEFHLDSRTTTIGHRRDLVAVREDGTQFPVEVGLGVAPGRPDLVTCVVTDLTERMRDDDERAALLERERAAHRRLERLQRVSDAGLAHLSMPDLLGQLLERTAQALDADTVSLLLVDDLHLVATASFGLEEEVTAGTRIPIGTGIAGGVAASGEAVLLNEVTATDIASAVLRRRGVQAIVAVPLIVESRLLGVLKVGSVAPNHFDRHDLELLQLVGDRVGLAIDRTHAFEREQAIAETLQRSLLPDRLPELHEATVAARYRAGAAGTKVGGDWYDVVPLGADSTALVIGDVMGRGVAAAAVTGRLRHAARAFLAVDATLDEAAAHLNQIVLDIPDSQIVTVALARLDTGRNRLEWVSAGHPPPLLRQPDGTVVVLEGSADVPLGVDREWSFTMLHADVEPGSTLLLYTDGLVERRDASLEVGLARLVDAVGAGPMEPDRLADALLDELLDDDRTTDDVALLIARLDPGGVRPLTIVVPPDARSLREVRDRLRLWLTEVGATEEERDDVLVAVSEALVATIDGEQAAWRVSAAVVGGLVDVSICDAARIEPPSDTGRGRGLVLMEALVDELEIRRSPDGGSIRLARRLSRHDPG